MTLWTLVANHLVMDIIQLMLGQSSLHKQSAWEKGSHKIFSWNNYTTSKANYSGQIVPTEQQLVLSRGLSFRMCKSYQWTT